MPVHSTEEEMRTRIDLARRERAKAVEEMEAEIAGACSRTVERQSRSQSLKNFRLNTKKNRHLTFPNYVNTDYFPHSRSMQRKRAQQRKRVASGGTRIRRDLLPLVRMGHLRPRTRRDRWLKKLSPCRMNKRSKGRQSFLGLSPRSSRSP